ncbi:hypothetical protein CL629_03615 [bacterium]|nr:hypothetical protein [bacterium]|tara:strand:- start:4739 stop:5149 length:411 start_codon:yes stop_codon:yes gene_type:complete
MNTSIRYPIIGGIILFALFWIFAVFNTLSGFPILDIPMHFIGGFFAAWFIRILLKKDIERTSWLGTLIIIVGGTAFIGITWEFFEWTIDYAVWEGFMGTRDDTLLDFVMDILGSITVAILVFKQGHAREDSYVQSN